MTDGSVDPATYRYERGERRPVEILVFRVDPVDVDEFVRVDHEVWTLGEASALGGETAPFLSKEVWLDDDRPGEITIVIEWPSIEAWNAVDDSEIQGRLAAEFDARFVRPYDIVGSASDAKRRRLRRWSRFEPATPNT
jgi:uncharacterized protein (TIGR03792 family)